MHRLNVVGFLVGLLIATPLLAAEPAIDPVNAFVRAEMQNQHIPGLTLLVSKNGRPIRTEGYGLSNLELHVPAKPDTIFESGSVGKSGQEPADSRAMSGTAAAGQPVASTTVSA